MDKSIGFNTPLYEVTDLVSRVTYDDVAFGGICFALILVVAAIYRQWRKGRGRRMIEKDRNNKEHELLLNIITDGLLDAEMAGKISQQRSRALCLWLAKKLGLKDLVPKQLLLDDLKRELKARRYSPKFEKERNHRPSIPGGPPTPMVLPKFGEIIGKFDKFRRAA